ncbi:serine protein kinase RIO [Microlunatus soli]|uniref:non-specific serine/threonine protein kinase n=1 Tax=Microlunatus soli TaxID=630515 RepID=A0A1H1V7M7_9ACTN|nr:RIO1 family regulatory kinase/ATPase [Microlunatus soli]SDS80715.1 RIO kinase 1 [Microlunatus soli]
MHRHDLPDEQLPRQAHPDPFDFTFIPTVDLDDDQRWSRYDEIGVLTGPEPVPDWVITASGAIETELGILKTGKEADVFLLERATDDAATVLAAKRYREAEHRQFHRDAGYSDARKTRNTRDRRAMAKHTAHGRSVQAGQWAGAEFGTLCELWEAGLPVPYPIQLDGTEILMELITDRDGEVAPRLAQTRPDHDQLRNYWDQLHQAMAVLAGRQQAHGDLSPFNILAAGDRLVIIDVPQVVDIVGNSNGMDFLARDCRNVCNWFATRGLPVDAEEVLAELISYAW